MTGLAKTLGIVSGAALMMNIVIGAGLLTLPGLAIKQSGVFALPAWLLCAVAAAPLLAVFIILGRRYPNAGGVPFYARKAFGVPGQQVATFLFLGAVVFGLPAIALVGGHYLASFLPGSPHTYAFVLLTLAIVPHLIPGEGAAKAMVWLASLVLAAIVGFLAVGVFGLDMQRVSLVTVAHWPAVDFSRITAPFMMLFFAFTGWEVGAGIAEEFRNPRRDYPAAMILSFAAATALYLAIAFIAQLTDLSGYFEAPFVAIVRPLLGVAGGVAVAVTAALIVFANLSGAVWGVSRLVYSLARDGFLPSWLASTHGGRPTIAVVATVGALLAVVGLNAIGAFSIETMLGLAGQNFLILYAIAAGALIALGASTFEKALAVLVLTITLLLLMLQGPKLVYPGLLCVAAAAFTALKSLALESKPETQS